MNHSHMNALVRPSFTASISPRMSLFTAVPLHQTPNMRGGVSEREEEEPWNRGASTVSQRSLSASTRAMTWLPLPGREMPNVVRLRSERDW